MNTTKKAYTPAKSTAAYAVLEILRKAKEPMKLSKVNMSISGHTSDAVSKAAQHLVSKGLALKPAVGYYSASKVPNFSGENIVPTKKKKVTAKEVTTELHEMYVAPTTAGDRLEELENNFLNASSELLAYIRDVHTQTTRAKEALDALKWT